MKNCTNCYYFNILTNPCDNCDAINGNFTLHTTLEELQKNHNCSEHWYKHEGEVICRICKVPQSEIEDAHNCYEHEEGGYCSWCGKNLQTAYDLFAPDLM